MMVRPWPCSDAQNLPQRQPRLRIETHGGLVEKENLRLVDQRAGDHQPLLLAAGELIHLRFSAVAEPELIEQRLRPGQRPGAGCRSRPRERGGSEWR